MLGIRGVLSLDVRRRSLLVVIWYSR